MKLIIKTLSIIVLISSSALFYSKSFSGVEDLVNRQFPWLKGKVKLKEIPQENGKDVFIIQTKKNKLFLNASSNSAASRGLDWYIKHYAHQSISHFGDNISTLHQLPQVEKPVKKTSFVNYRYALNYCTINYSFSFYTWKEWENELDWVALNGVNIMLN